MPTMHQFVGSESSPPASAQTAYRGATIAVIDDDDDTREVLCTKLSRAGYTPVGFDGGKSALEAMDKGVRPDLILLDLVMPGMNGWEFRVAQKQRPAIAQIPAVALSGDLSPYAAAIDASARLTKPVDVRELRDVIDHLLAVMESRQQTLRNAEVDRGRALGMLVASVAHEINNPLTYVSGSVELALQELAQTRTGEPLTGEALRPLLEAARDGTQRVAFIVRLLSTFVHSDEQDVRVVDPLRALDAATRLAMHYIRPRARLVFMPGLTPLVNANEARLAQIFLNLLVNAAQSIPEGEPAKHEVRISTDVRPGKVLIEVSDTGHGVPPQLHTSIFEPFSATDAAASGSGLSLAITRAMVESLGGSLTFIAHARQGSTFRIELPAVDSQPQPEPDVPNAEHPVLPLKSESRVLVIDDEPLVGRLVEAALMGHVVDVITDPAQGLQLARDGHYDLVLCDLKMPDISGIEVYDRLATERPDLCARFVLMTGAASDAEVEHFLARTSVLVLRKPFAIRDLRSLVQRFVPARASAE